jgi:hypothetical protein
MVSGCVSPWHGQTDDKLLETLAKIIKIDSKIKLKLKKKINKKN